MIKTYQRVKDWRKNNPEKLALQRRRYQLKNWDKIKEYQREWARKKRKSLK